MSERSKVPLMQVDRYRWRIPRHGKMRTDGLVFADRELIEDLEDQALIQVENVACLPGIVGPSIAMPDVHWGYGFPIGGVAAFDPEGGVISPGGVGYDINCGVRLMTSSFRSAEVRPRLESLVDALFADIPSGVGSSRSDLRLSDPELEGVLAGGAQWAVERGLGRAEDLEAIEGGGRLSGAEVARVSERARRRGRNQIGTLGSGNHFVEVGRVAERFDETVADALGLLEDTVTVLIHTGSRGLGHQVCDDYLDLMVEASGRYGIELPDKQLCCAPLGSPEADAYLGAMNAAANFAFANRQAISHYVRESFSKILGGNAGTRLSLVYDVAHNIAKMEDHRIGSSTRRVCVHRKGATRAFPPGHSDLAGRYRELGQPVLIPGDMGRYSYVLVGTERAFDETFGSCCHGAGRRLSRRASKREARPRNLPEELAARGILVRAASRATIDEEIPEAYKDVREVVDVVAGGRSGRSPWGAPLRGEVDVDEAEALA
jgi:tRNA-splicing ligase RtcB (3'-phosphate/5'-hydroxy nucleic acid ligase)